MQWNASNRNTIKTFEFINVFSLHYHARIRQIIRSAIRKLRKNSTRIWNLERELHLILISYMHLYTELKWKCDSLRVNALGYKFEGSKFELYACALPTTSSADRNWCWLWALTEQYIVMNCAVQNNAISVLRRP